MLRAFNLRTLFEFDPESRAKVVEEGVSAAGRIRNPNTSIGFARLIVDGITTTHTIPELCANDASRLKLYVGRAGATSEHVLGRFRNSINERAHSHALILARVLTEHIADAETGMINIFKPVDDAGGLCINQLENLATFRAGSIATES